MQNLCYFIRAYDRVVASLANRILDYEANIRDDMDNMANDVQCHQGS